MSNFIINKPAESHAIELFAEYNIKAVPNNTLAKTDVDVYLPELDLYADEKTKYSYSDWISFDAISIAHERVEPSHNLTSTKNTLAIENEGLRKGAYRRDIADKLNKLTSYTIKLKRNLSWIDYVNSYNPFFRVDKLGTLLDPKVAYGVHHLKEDRSHPGNRGDKWSFKPNDRAFIIDYEVMRDWIQTGTNWQSFRFNRKGSVGAGLGDNYLSAFFAVPLKDIPPEAIVFRKDARDVTNFIST